MKTSLTLISAGLMMGLFAGGAHAATLCSSSSPPALISVVDMTFEGANADDCYGIVQGNDSGNSVPSNVWIDTGWTLFAKDDIGGSLTTGTIEGITFSLDATPDTAAEKGDWTLSWAKTGSPGYDLTMDVVGVLKASDQFASYLFEDLTFTANGSGTGTWEVSYKKNDKNIPDLSHLSLYYKNALNSTSGGTSGNTSGGTSGNTSGGTSGNTSGGTSGGATTSSTGNIPEPGMVGLLGIGLLGQALILRQRRRRLQK